MERHPTSFGLLVSKIFLLLLAALPLVASAHLESTGISVKLNDVDYYISPFSAVNVTVGLDQLKDVPSVFGFKPVTVVGTPTVKSDLAALFKNWTSTDDVFNHGFIGAVFLAGADAVSKQALFNSCTSGSVVLPLDANHEGTVPSGPYFLETATGRLFPVYRLYVDFAEAFSTSLLQRPDGGFQPLSAQVQSSSSLTIGVPSRLYYTRTADKPLAGVRIGVKDIFDLKGVKRSNGNRAWYQLYPAAEHTAPAMQRLIDAGAVMIGLQKPSQFANGESPTADWVDYHAPYNPRGDGYQDPSSSSSGAGASVASYDWLDIAVGSDTGGSIRGPGGVGGVFGNRPSHGLVTLDGVMPLSPSLDTAGFLLRDPHLWDVANQVIYSGNYTSVAKATYPKRIRTLGFPAANATEPWAVLMNGFVQKLASFIGSDTSVEPIVLNNEWMSSGPVDAKGSSLDDMLRTTYAVIITKHQTELVRDPFYRDYAAAFDGRKPFVNPAPLARWAYGDSLPATALSDALRNKTIFKDWFNDLVLPRVSDEAQCTSSILLYPSSTGAGQSYRNRYSGPPSVPIAFSSSRVSVFAEVPDSVFPLGEVVARSNVTGHDEMYPVSIDVLVAKGCDGLLARLAADLTDAGVLKVPKTGRTLDGGIPAMR
ncbi:hypothetical protein MCOR25_009659 [Pyricularia grisea]|nr:hypothetical protein MCOR25_009659 [Pyricularia grisea]